jgi:pimeloyl-ACP methyl ester carboxylesterase
MRYSFLRKTFFYTTLALLLFYLATIGYIKIDEASLVFFPNDHYLSTPADSSWRFSELSVKTGPENALYGWKIEGALSDSAAPVILYFPGSAGNISWELAEFSVLRQVSSAVYAFDFYGFGKSSGIISEEAVGKTARDALTYLLRKENISPGRIILYGHQLGANPALILAETEKVKGVIIESAFTSLPELANEIYPILPLKQIMSISMDNLAAVKKITVPLLVIHSEEDKVIPSHHGETLYDAATGPRKLLLLKTGSHQNALQKNKTLFIDTFREFAGESHQ